LASGILVATTGIRQYCNPAVLDLTHAPKHVSKSYQCGIKKFLKTEKKNADAHDLKSFVAQERKGDLLSLTLFLYTLFTPFQPQCLTTLLQTYQAGSYLSPLSLLLPSFKNVLSYIILACFMVSTQMSSPQM
jgi:hypothetical protein